jgi:magnesium chelatase subunit I
VVLDHLEALGVGSDAAAPLRAAAAEFVLEGLWAQKKIGRSDDRGFVAPERRAEGELDLERLERLRKLKKQVN